MAKLTLSDVSNILGNPTSAAATINANNTLIETAIENTLSRDGASPNQLTADLDANNNDITNVGALDVDSLSIGGETVQSVTIATALKIDNNLSDVASVPASVANLGLTIGANTQAFDAGLQSISGLTTAADKMIYTTAPDVYAATDLTGFARTILDDTTASAVLSTLGFSAFSQTLIDDTSDAEWRATLGLGTAAIANTGTAGEVVPFLDDINTWSAKQIIQATSASVSDNLFQVRDDRTTTTSEGNIVFSIKRQNSNTDALSLGNDANNAGLFGSNNSSLRFGKWVSGVFTEYGLMTNAGVWTLNQLTLTTDLAVADGGTGASTAAAARTNLGLVIGTDVQAFRLVGSATYDPPSLADGVGATTTVTVTGAALGDFAIPSFSLSTQGITVTANITATDTATVRFQNETGGTIDLASGTLRVAVFK